MYRHISTELTAIGEPILAHELSAEQQMVIHTIHLVDVAMPVIYRFWQCLSKCSNYCYRSGRDALTGTGVEGPTA